MTNPYAYSRAAAVTPDDNNNLPVVDAGFPHAKGLYIGTAGALKILTSGGDTVTFGNVGVGHLYVEALKVFATGTTASNITALY